MARRTGLRQAGRPVSPALLCWQECVGLCVLEARCVFVRLLMGFVFGVAVCGGAVAQTREDMLRCRSISDEARRLACYDAVELAGNPRRKYEIVDLTELKSFALSYRGQLVEVIGWIRPAKRSALSRRR